MQGNLLARSKCFKPQEKKCWWWRLNQQEGDDIQQEHDDRVASDENEVVDEDFLAKHGARNTSCTFSRPTKWIGTTGWDKIPGYIYNHSSIDQLTLARIPFGHLLSSTIISKLTLGPRQNVQYRNTMHIAINLNFGSFGEVDTLLIALALFPHPIAPDSCQLGSPTTNSRLQ